MFAAPGRVVWDCRQSRAVGAPASAVADVLPPQALSFAAGDRVRLSGQPVGWFVGRRGTIGTLNGCGLVQFAECVLVDGRRPSDIIVGQGGPMPRTDPSEDN